MINLLLRKLDEKKPRVLQLGAESTFEGGGDKPLVYTFLRQRAICQTMADQFLGDKHGMHRQLDRQRRHALRHGLCGRNWQRSCGDDGWRP